MHIIVLVLHYNILVLLFVFETIQLLIIKMFFVTVIYLDRTIF